MTISTKSKRKRLLRRNVSGLQHLPQHRRGRMSSIPPVEASVEEQYKLGKRQGNDANNAAYDSKAGKRSDRRGDIEGKCDAFKGLCSTNSRGLGSQQNKNQQHHRSHCNTDEPVVDLPVRRSHASTALVSSQEEWEIEAILDRRARKGKNGKYRARVRVKWKCTWVDECNVHAPELLRKLMANSAS